MDHHGGGERAIERLAAVQFGVFSRLQLSEAGVSRRVTDRRIESGRWEGVLPRVYRASVVPASGRQAALAACLWSAPDGLISHQTAAVLWGLEGIETTAVHLTVPSECSLRSSRVVVHRTHELLAADRARQGPITLTSPLRTLIDVAATLDRAALEVATEDALRRRLCTAGQLRWRAGELLGQGRSGSTMLRTLLSQRTLGRTGSRWELRTARILTAAGLPEPVRQHEVGDDGVFVARVDLAYPDARVVLEYDSDEWHHGVARRHRDAERRNALRAAGWTVIEVTPALLRRPDVLVRVVLAALGAQPGGRARRNSWR